MHIENLLGLPLDLARELLEQEVVVVSSAPPFFPRGYTAHFGEERVVRAKTLFDGKIELLVARELIAEERASFSEKRGAEKDGARR